MTRFITGWLPRMVAGFLVLLLAVPVPARGQDAAAPPPFKPEELEQLAAPIALYPDPLVAQVLMASTYPLEVVQAARFVKANPNLKGAQLDEALKKYDWDNSVKALTPFPQVLAMMDEKIDWTQKLGDAFLDQQKDVMDAIQRLRQKAQAQGNLKDSKEQKVVVEPAPPPPTGQPAQQQTIIKIEPADPQVVYVPTYNPTVVYGAWPYPAYPPYYYYPPGYAFAGAAFGFAAGVAIGAAFGGAWGWGNCNWGGGDVNIDVNRQNQFNRNVNNTEIANKRAERQGQSNNFKHNPENRKGTQYRNQATQQKFDKAGPANAQSRDQFRGRAEQGRQDLGRGGADQGRGGGPGGDRAGQRPGGGAGGDFGQGRGGQGGGAFDGAGRGGDVKSFSDRGSASRGSMSSGSSSLGGGRPSSMQSGGGSRGGSGGFSGGGGGSRGGGGGGRGGGGGGGRGGRR